MIGLLSTDDIFTFSAMSSRKDSSIKPSKDDKSAIMTESEIEARLARIREEKKRLQSDFQKSGHTSIQPSASSSQLHSYDPKDILKQEYRFIRSEKDDEEAQTSWEKKLAKNYHDSLYKEYAIIDLSKYEKGKIGLRWRVEREVRSGKGEYICGNKVCDSTVALERYEVPFKYIEDGESKMALVKVTMCPSCAKLLQHHTQYKKISSPHNKKREHPRTSNDEAESIAKRKKREDDETLEEST